MTVYVHDVTVYITKERQYIQYVNIKRNVSLSFRASLYPEGRMQTALPAWEAMAW